MKARAMIGVSGFSYAGWKGSFYPNNLKSEGFLSYYSQRLNSVEINSSFYAPPNSAMVKSWASRTGDNFRFSFKAPTQITHILKLGKGSVDAAERLGVTPTCLGENKGPVASQL